MIPLDSPVWGGLRHAYGTAEDIPALLQAIATYPADSSPTEGPWFELWSALCHQGDVYSASFAAVPHVIEILSRHLNRACFDFFLLPASIEVARFRHEIVVPHELAEDYHRSLARLPGLVSGAADRAWDPTLCQSILAATAVGKDQHALARLLLEIDEAYSRNPRMVWLALKTASIRGAGAALTRNRCTRNDAPTRRGAPGPGLFQHSA